MIRAFDPIALALGYGCIACALLFLAGVAFAEYQSWRRRRRIRRRQAQHRQPSPTQYATLDQLVGR